MILIKITENRGNGGSDILKLVKLRLVNNLGSITTLKQLKVHFCFCQVP